MAPATATPTPPARPSFDCAKASAEVEKLICSTDELARLDAQLGEAYTALIAALRSATGKGSPEEERAAQLQFLKARNVCSDVSCVAKAYRERIDVLRQKLTQVSQ